MEKKPQKFIIDVIPVNRLPLNKQQFYSYLWDSEIPAGSLVSVPLFKRNVSGIVSRSRTDFHRLGNIKLKKINSVVEENFLTKNQIKLAEFISDYYFSPLGTVMKFFIPKRTKLRKQKIAIDFQTKKKKIKLTKEQKNSVSKIAPSKSKIQSRQDRIKFYLYGPAGSGKTEVYIHSILKLKENNPELQFLILLPELTLTPQAVERYGEYFKPDETAVLNSKISKGRFYDNWQKIKSGEAKIIIGSRMAVFAPFKNLGLIVVDEEQDISFKQWDMNPRYDARRVSEELSRLYSCPIIFGSATPSIENFYRTRTKEIGLLALPRLSLKNSPALPDVEIIDLKKERWKNKNFGTGAGVSKKLEGEISYALKNKLQTILFLNRQGMSNFSVCNNCKTVLKCPQCDRALIYDRQGFYRCVHCSFKTSITPECPKCKGIAFTNIGNGTQKLEREIENLFPGARIARIDNQSTKESSAEEIYKKFSRGEIDILIGTQMISKGWDLPNVALVGIIDADNLLSIPDFSANIKAFQHIVQLSGRVGRPGAKFPGKVVIQTYNPENKLFQAAAVRNFENIFERELLERKALLLPPFGKIIKIIFQDYDLKKVKGETEKVHDILQEKNPDISVTEPQDALASKVRGRYRRQITIKFSYRDVPDRLKQIIFSLPSGWIVDVDPISLI